MAICSYFYDDGDVCFDLHIKNNIVGGAQYMGYGAPGHNCGDYSGDNFVNNTAHSIDGAKSGMGAYIFPDPAFP